MTRIAMATLAIVLMASTAQADMSVGPGTINWKGIEWTVDANATAETKADGSLYIEVDGETGDPAYDNWNVHADFSSLFSAADYAKGAWIEFSFIDSMDDGYNGGPRAYLDTWEDRTDNGSTLGKTEYMSQGGVHHSYANYIMNNSAYSSTDGWQDTNWYWSPQQRTPGEHTFKVVLNTTSDTLEYYFDGDLVGSASGPERVPTYFETAYLGVTSNSWDSGTFGSGTYTDLQYGVMSVPVPGAAVLGCIGLSIVGFLRRRFA